MALNLNKDVKLYYSISEVAKKFNVTETLLRYWEKEFPNIKPEKGGRGVRQYSKEDLEQVELVYNLVKVRGLTLQGARDAIKAHGKNVKSQVDIVNRLVNVRNELQAINKQLNGLV
ncbi:MAG: MerR family transcriptional regulator [Bacteroidaceae bacterium]|nr:MerR family transcriptional regulator [Bacteroidaceae bacterium]MBP5523486.1 MerR family transcriptional regulator [Bacteroidaceae bacterium]